MGNIYHPGNDHDLDDGNMPPEDVKPTPAAEVHKEEGMETPPVVEPEAVKEGPVDDRITNVVAQQGALQAQFESFRSETTAQLQQINEKLGAVEGIAAMSAELTIITEAIREEKETDQPPEKENWLTKKWL